MKTPKCSLFQVLVDLCSQDKLICQKSKDKLDMAFFYLAFPIVSKVLPVKKKVKVVCVLN
jgi:hypothetical protein